jgi:hypothetical protein
LDQGKAFLVLRIWKLRNQRNANQHYDAADFVRSRDRRLSIWNIGGSIGALTFGFALTKGEQYLLPYAPIAGQIIVIIGQVIVGIAAIIFVVTGILQAIFDYRTRASQYKHAGVNFARISRRIDQALTVSDPLTEKLMDEIRCSIDIVSASSPNVPAEIFKDPRHDDLTKKIDELESQLVGE